RAPRLTARARISANIASTRWPAKTAEPSLVRWQGSLNQRERHQPVLVDADRFGMALRPGPRLPECRAGSLPRAGAAPARMAAARPSGQTAAQSWRATGLVAAFAPRAWGVELGRSRRGWIELRSGRIDLLL